VDFVLEQVDPGQQVGDAGGDRAAEFFLDADHPAFGTGKIARLERGEHPLGQVGDGLFILSLGELD
jgi:hypothetical protein